MKKRVLGLIIVLPTVTFAQAVSKNWSVYSSLETRTSMEQIGKNRKVQEMSVELIPSLSLPNGGSVRAYFGVSKELQNTYETTLANSFIGYSQKLIDLNPDTKVSTEFRGYIPLNETSRENESLQTRIYGALSLGASLRIPSIEKTSLSLKISAHRNFHEFETSNTASVNTKYSISETISLGLQINKKWSFSTYFTNGHSFSYQNNRKPDAFEMGQSISYALNDTTEISFGHNLGGRTFKDNGVSNNIEFYNRDESTIYASLGINF
ncbi:MAG: hypothetical protein Fur0010_03430 [Bdellovibrio sp.]